MTRNETITALAIAAVLNGNTLRGADLGGANLREADLRGAYLRGADLRGAYLRGADLGGANLREADLREADLREADLRGADLRGADLRGADLRGADLRGADLGRAKTDSKTRWPAFQIPQEGVLIVFKKTRQGVIKLEVPADAKRTASLIGRKCRAEFVRTLEICTSGLDVAIGSRDGKTRYAVGKITRPDKYDDDPKVECTHGIHFFLTREEAEAY